MNTVFFRYLVQLILLALPITLFTLLPLFAVKNILDDDTDAVQKLFCFLFACMMVSFCHIYSKLLIAPLELSNESNAPLLRTSLICFGLCLLLGAFFFRTLYVKLPTLLAEETLHRAWRYLLLIPLLLTILFLWASPLEAAVVMTGRVRSTSILFLTMVPPVLWLFVHGAFWITTRMSESARIREENDMLQMEGKRYRELREYMDETKALRHDFRQHLSVITELNRSGRSGELAEYLGQYTESVTDMHTPFCKNKAVDAIASHYETLAKAQDTRIVWSLDLPEELPVLEMDYCAVFGNLVENALRAVRNLPADRREISVTSQMLSGVMLGLSVKNLYEGEIRFDKRGLPKSSREGHGIGLFSVRNTAKKYRGSVDVKTMDGVFTVVVLMNKQ